VRLLLPPEAEPRVLVALRRVIIVIAVVYLALGAWGMYRRIVQVLRVEMTQVPNPLLPGSVVQLDVITSGETFNLIRLELIQGARRAILFERFSEVNRVNTIDPRVFRYTPQVVVTPATLAGFQRGTATLRLTVFGNVKLLRTPAPRVREVKVRLAP
jgi:hypothetical protein